MPAENSLSLPLCPWYRLKRLNRNFKALRQIQLHFYSHNYGEKSNISHNTYIPLPLRVF